MKRPPPKHPPPKHPGIRWAWDKLPGSNELVQVAHLDGARACVVGNAGTWWARVWPPEAGPGDAPEVETSHGSCMSAKRSARGALLILAARPRAADPAARVGP